ncbi:MAG: MFS transporter [Clostridia bacterium]|nr:MFS transporter [Clostridia bacterium]
MLKRRRDPEKRFTKAEKSWIAYDWANSVYATNIMAAIFPIYYAGVAGDLGNKWWGIGVSIASLCCALLAPTLGAVADFKGYKKKLLAVFIGIGVVFTALMAFVGDWRLMLIGYVISRIGFSGSCVFYDSFITDVTTHERMDRVSAWGYAMGYIGGSTIPFVISIVVLLMTNYADWAIKFSILITSVWWAAFSIPILLNVRQRHYVETPPRELAKNAGKNLWDTAKKCVTNKGLFIYLIAYFLYIDGVGTIISLATNYGSTLGLGSTGMILALLVTQIVAVPFSILFSRLAGRFGAIRMIVTAICVYFCICGVGFFMGRMVEPHQLAYSAEARAVLAEAEVAPAGSADARVWRGVIDDVAEAGRNAMAEADRPAAFAAMFADMRARLADPDSVAYAFEDAAARGRAVAAIDALEARMAPFVQDTAAQQSYDAARQTASLLFWVLAALVGTVQGGIQALSRSYFGKLVPKARSAEYFGFYDVFGRFAAVIGPLLYALFYMLTDRASVGILSLLILFAGGAALLVAGRKQLARTELEVQEANRREEEGEACGG